MTIYLGLGELLDIAAEILSTQPKVRDYGLLESAAARPQTSVFGQDAYPDLATKAAALLHSICTNHALIDGNKRLAWAATRMFVWENTGEQPRHVSSADAIAFMYSVADGSITEVADVAAELRRLGVVD